MVFVFGTALSQKSNYMRTVYFISFNIELMMSSLYLYKFKLELRFLFINAFGINRELMG